MGGAPFVTRRHYVLSSSFVHLIIFIELYKCENNLVRFLDV